MENNEFQQDDGVSLKFDDVEAILGLSKQTHIVEFSDKKVQVTYSLN
ncbi:hypothetical protein HOH87_01945 [bacterium]|nr:hypothetical protein [bacterium]